MFTEQPSAVNFCSNYAVAIAVAVSKAALHSSSAWARWQGYAQNHTTNTKRSDGKRLLSRPVYRAFKPRFKCIYHRQQQTQIGGLKLGVGARNVGRQGDHGACR